MNYQSLLRLRALSVFILILGGSLHAQENKRPFRDGLVVMISMDQFKAEYFDWYGKNWSGGLKRLYEEGIVYTKADLDYAASETGPGHATLSTGSFPSIHGILGNEWTDRETRKSVYCVADSTSGKVSGEGGGMSPRNLVVEGLGDWMKASYPASRVVSISVKDRAAVLMGGKKPDHVYWYNGNSGHLVTSDYYTREPAGWVKEFNSSNWVFKSVPPVWNKMLDSSAYLGPDKLEGEMVWAGSTTFPKVFDLIKRSSQMTTSPWGDLFVLDAARAAIAAEKLGSRGVPDLLAIGLSCTDYVGHAYGPNSHEMQDHLARVDVALGSFLAELETTLGKDKVFVVLSSDHGCLPLPEYTSNVEHKFARRLNVSAEITPKVEQLQKNLQEEWKTNEWLFTRDGFMNYEEAEKRGIPPAEFESRLHEGLTGIDGIADVIFRREVSAGTVPNRPYAVRFANSMYIPRAEDFQVRFCEGCLPSSRNTGTSHGSCYDYDNAVPVVFWGQPFTTNRIGRAVRTVDVAPTIARKVGVVTPAYVSGRPLLEVMENVK